MVSSMRSAAPGSLIALTLTACPPAPPHEDSTRTESDAASTTVGSTDGSSSSTDTSTSGSTHEPTSDSTGSATSSSTGAIEPCSEVVEGDLFVWEDTDLASLANVGHVTDDVFISMGALPQTDLSFLSCLHTIGYGLAIDWNDRLETTEGLENLKSVRAIVINHNANLRLVTGFEQISELTSLIMSSNPSLEEIALDTFQEVETLRIGSCLEEQAAASHFALVDLAGFSGLTRVKRLTIDGNEALLSADLLDVLAQNGDPLPLEETWIRFNPLLSETLVHQQLNALDVNKREVCGNAEGAAGCFCLVGD